MESGSLNQFLQPTDAPVSETVSPANAYFFNKIGGRNSITGTKIKNFNFSQGKGGTLTLGGTSNGNGLALILDGTGGTSLAINNTGIQLFGTSSLQGVIPGNGTLFYFGPSANGTVYLQTAVGIPMVYSMNGAPTIFQMGASSTGTLTINGFVQTNGSATLTGNMNINGQFACATFFVNNNQLTLNKKLEVDNGDTTIFNDGANVKITNGAFVKTAIVPTSKGHKALYCAESPEVWFFDFCDSRETIDPLFLEVTEGKMRFIKLEDGGYQVWRRRKGFENTRFEAKTAEQFQKNNDFWSIPQK